MWRSWLGLVVLLLAGAVRAMHKAGVPLLAGGKRADLVLLDADPLAAVASVRKASGVVVAGKWLPKADLDGRLKRLTQKDAAP